MKIQRVDNTTHKQQFGAKIIDQDNVLQELIRNSPENSFRKIEDRLSQIDMIAPDNTICISQLKEKIMIGTPSWKNHDCIRNNTYLFDHRGKRILNLNYRNSIDILLEVLDNIIKQIQEPDFRRIMKLDLLLNHKVFKK